MNSFLFSLSIKQRTVNVFYTKQGESTVLATHFKFILSINSVKAGHDIHLFRKSLFCFFMSCRSCYINIEVKQNLIEN